MALISGGILVLMRILGHDFSGHYNPLALISVDIINRVYSIKRLEFLCRSGHNKQLLPLSVVLRVLSVVPLSSIHKLLLGM